MIKRNHDSHKTLSLNICMNLDSREYYTNISLIQLSKRRDIYRSRYRYDQCHISKSSVGINLSSSREEICRLPADCLAARA